MSDCPSYERDLQALIAGELDDGRHDALALHVAGCEACAEVYDMHQQLVDEGGLPEPSRADLVTLRHNVLSRIRAERAGGARPVPIAAGRGRRPGAPPARRWLALAAVLAAAVIGLVAFAAGQRSAGGAGPEQAWIDALERGARGHRDLDAIEGSPYQLSDVRVRRTGHDRVAVGFALSSYFETTRSLDDPLLQEALVHALLDRSSVGARLQAIEVAAATLTPPVTQALAAAIEDDPNLAVRMAALNTLATLPPDEARTQTYLRVLRDDQAVSMRLLAVDVLRRAGLSAPELRQTILARDPEAADAALLARADALFEM